VGALLASNLVPKELSRRTALVVLSRPVSRLEWVLGLASGAAAALAAHWLILCGALLATLALSGGAPAGVLLVAPVMCLVEALVVTCVALLFSSFSTPALSVTLTLGVLLVGSSSSQLRLLQERSDGIMAALLGAVHAAVPALERFQLAENVVYSIPVT